MKSAFIALLVLVVLGLAASQGWQAWQRQHYTGLLPAQIEVQGGRQGVRHLGVQEGLREGCGAVVFKLSPQMVQALGSQGMAALAQARQPRSQQGASQAYSAWQPTPYVEHNPDGTALQDRWLSGLSCAALPADLAGPIDQALRQPGAYVATSAEGGIIVIPALGMAVLSFMG